MTPIEIATALRRGLSVSDAEFDSLLSAEARDASARFWTPVDVARRACRWLSDAGAERVIDIGSGVGKACVVGSLSTGLVFDGLEKRPALVLEARTLALQLGIDTRSRFQCAALTTKSCDGYDALYAFNPFGEQLYHLSELYSAEETTGVEGFARDLRAFERLLRRVERGFRLITYHGCGAHIPDTYELSRCEFAGTNVMRMWTKVRTAERGGYWKESFELTELWSFEGGCEKFACGARVETLPAARAK